MKVAFLTSQAVAGPRRPRVAAWFSAGFPVPPSWRRCCGRPRSSATRTERRLLRAAQHRRPARDRPPAHPAGGVRLHRRRRRRGAVAATARGPRSPGSSSSPTVLRDVSTVDTSREILGQAVDAAVRVRADRLHPDDAHTRASAPWRRWPSEVGIPYTLSTMGTTTIEDVAAAAPGRPQVVPALPVAGPRAGQGPRAAGRRRRLRHPDADRGHPGRRGPAARRAQRADRSRRRCRCAPSSTGPCTRNWWFDLLTTEPLTFASLESTDGTVGRADQPGLRPRADHGRRRVAARHLARASW